MISILLFCLIPVFPGFPGGQPANASGALPRGEIPVLCYHNVRQNVKHGNLLTIGDEAFNEQMKFLHDSGYHSISPEQLVQYLTSGKELPLRPVMITFDDSHEEHFSIVK